MRRALLSAGVIAVMTNASFAQPAQGGRGGGRGGSYPTAEQWTSMPPKAKEYVEKARVLAGSDPDLLFDFDIFCKASAGASNEDRATVGVPNSEPRLQPYPAPNPAVVIGGQRLFDNFYWIGNTSIGAWLITSNDGYILFDTMNSEADARDIIIPAIKKLNLDPMRIRYVVFGHHHFDHTGGGEHIQRTTGARAIMGRDDWDIYLRSSGRGGSATQPKMKRDIDAVDGMKIAVGDVTATIFQMTGHTPGHSRLSCAESRVVHRWLRAHLGRGDQDEGRIGDAGSPEHQHESARAHEVRTRALPAGEESAAVWRRANRAIPQYHPRMHAGASGDLRLVSSPRQSVRQCEH